MLGQVWYLIVSISDLCLLAYFDINLHGIVHFSAARLAVSAPPCMEIALGIIFCYVPGVTRKEFRKPKFCYLESQQKALLKFNKIY